MSRLRLFTRYKKSLIYIVLAFCFSSFALLGFLTVSSLTALHREEEQSYQILYSSSKLGKSISDMEASIRGYKLYNNSVYLSPYYEGSKVFAIERKNLLSLLKDREERELVNSIYYNANKWRYTVKSSIYKDIASFTKTAPERSRIVREVKSQIAVFQEVESLRIKKVIKDIKQTELRLTVLYYLSFLFSILAILLSSRQINKSWKDFSKANEQLKEEAEEKSKIETELFKSLAIRSLIIDNFTQGVIIYDDKGLIVQLNKEADRILEVAKNTVLIGTHINSLFVNEDFSPTGVICSVAKTTSVNSQSKKSKTIPVTVTPYKASIGYTVVFSLFISEASKIKKAVNNKK